MNENILELRPNGDDTEICKIDKESGELVYYENSITKIKLEIVPWEGSYIPDYIKDINDPEVEKCTKLTTVDGIPIRKTHEISVIGKGFCTENNELGIHEYRWIDNENFVKYLIVDPDGNVVYSLDPKYSSKEKYKELDRVIDKVKLETKDGLVKTFKDGIKCKFVIDSCLVNILDREWYYNDKLVQKINTIIEGFDMESSNTVFDSKGNVVYKSTTVSVFPRLGMDGYSKDIGKFANDDNFFSVVYAIDRENEKSVNSFKDINNSYMKRESGFIHTYNGFALDSDFIIYCRVEYGIPMFLNSVKQI